MPASNGKVAKLALVILSLALSTRCVTAFSPPTFMVSSTTGTPPTDEESSEPRLPPGRRTPRFINFLFDDSVKLLNPKTMASYQVERTQEYGSIFKTNIFLKRAVFCTSEDTVTQLAKEEAKKTLEAFFPPHHHTLFGPQALIVQSGPTHMKLRRLIQPSLSPASIKSFMPMVEKSMKSFLDELKKEDDTFEMVPKLRSFFIRIAVRILFGEGKLEDKEEEELAEELTIWSRGLLSAPLTFIPWSTAAKAMRARKRIVQKLERWIEEERSSPSSSKTSLLSKLVSSRDEEGDGSGLSNADIMDNVLTLVFAGSDTTASAATSLCMILWQNPNLASQLQSNPSLVSSFCQAILQSYPPAPFQFRLAKQDLEVDDYVIPSGWLVAYGFAGALLQLGEVDWSDSTALSKISADMAFGTGPRMCPGRYLALMELETLSQLLISEEQKDAWELVRDQSLEQRYTPGFFPIDGLKVQRKPEPVANYMI